MGSTCSGPFDLQNRSRQGQSPRGLTTQRFGKDMDMDALSNNPLFDAESWHGRHILISHVLVQPSKVPKDMYLSKLTFLSQIKPAPLLTNARDRWHARQNEQIVTNRSLRSVSPICFRSAVGSATHGRMGTCVSFKTVHAAKALGGDSPPKQVSRLQK